MNLPVPKRREVDVTLRITREKGEPSRARLKLEGRIVAECVALLERECTDLLRSRSAVHLDLAGVSFVDWAAVEALERLSRAGVEISCRSGPVASVLEGEDIRVMRESNGVDDGQP
jgi:ABC-type transporter Mla MlaB component